MTAEFGDFGELRIYSIKITEKKLVCNAGETYCEVKEQTGADSYNVRFRFIWTEEMGEGFREMVGSHAQL